MEHDATYADPRHVHTSQLPVPRALDQGYRGLLDGMASHSYMRNHLSYQAAGLAVDDKNKFQWYRTEGKSQIAEYEAWVQNMKLQLNAQQMWGRSAVFYPSCSYGSGRFHYHYYGLSF